MKKRIQWLEILIIFSLSLNSIIHFVFYIIDRKVGDLILFVISFVCLNVYLIVSLITNFSKMYYFIYNHSFWINGKNILEDRSSKVIGKKHRNKIRGYNLIDKYIYRYADEKIEITYSLLDFKENISILVVYKMKYKETNKAMFGEENIRKYYESHSIKDIEEDNVIKLNNRNCIVIRYENGNFVASKYRHYVPIRIYDIKAINNYQIGWEEISYKCYYDSLEEAKRLSEQDLLK